MQLQSGIAVGERLEATKSHKIAWKNVEKPSMYSVVSSVKTDIVKAISCDRSTVMHNWFKSVHVSRMFLP